MTTTTIEPRAVQAKIADALTGNGWLRLTVAETEALADADPPAWEAFALEWDSLTLDQYMADGGKYRLRRYSRFALDLDAGELVLQPHGPYVQSYEVNHLNGGIERHFDPCTDQFCQNPVLTGLLTSLGESFTSVHGTQRWDVRLHPYRILADRAQEGQPAPEGRHRDGVTYIMTLMIGRHQIEGGESSIYSEAGEKLTAVTLTQRGELILGDDRTTTHAVTGIHPAGSADAGHRDVLVIAFTAVNETP